MAADSDSALSSSSSLRIASSVLGGGVGLAKVRDRAAEAVTAQLRESLLGPLEGQLWLLLFLLFGPGIGWYYLALGLFALFR